MKNLDSLDTKALIKLIQDQQTLLCKFQIQTDEQNETIHKLVEQIQKLQDRLDKALHLLYGTKSEKRKTKADHKEPPKSDNKVTNSNSRNPSKKNKSANGRAPLSDSLPRVKFKHDIPEDERFCGECHFKIHMMGKVVTEQLGYKPAEFFVKEHTRYKYKCNCCGCIKTASMPPQPIDKGLADAAVLAEVVINKYQDCLPLYRQQRRFARHGINIPISTLCDWSAQTALLLEPIVEYMKRESILPSKRIFTDDTTYFVQDKDEKGKTHTGRLWTYVGGPGKSPACVVYEYTKTRAKSAPKKFLDGFKGYLQADAYPGYDALYKTGDIIEVACWAHARRPFSDIIKLTKDPGTANKALKFIGELYAIEDKIKHLPSEQNKFFRRRYSKPILRNFRLWLKRVERSAVPKSLIDKALGYLKNHWQALNNYLRDGC